MKKIIRIMLAVAIAASALTFSACSTQNEPAPAVSDSTVSASDVSASDSSADKDSGFVIPEVSLEDIEVPAVSDLKYASYPGFDSAPASEHMGETHTTSLPVKMWSGYITERKEFVDIGEVRILLDKDMYVPSYAGEYMQKLVDALEEVSGLSFFKAKNNEYKITVNVEKTEPYEYDDFISEGELGSAWAALFETKDLNISSGDLFLGMSEALAHEMSHTLHAAQNTRSFCQMLNEGFAEYNCYKAVQYLEKNAPEVAYALNWSGSSINNMDIPDPSTVYTQTVEYWMENDFPFEYSGNGPYSLGFRFMAYLEDVYGNYSEWLVQSANVPCVGNDYPVEDQIKILKAVYGEDVLDGFYPWLKKNEDRFTANYFPERTKPVYDMTGADSINLYPHFYNWECPSELTLNPLTVKYDNLYINMMEYKKYLSEYKGRSLDNLKLDIMWAEGGCVELFDNNGVSMGERTCEEGETLSVDLDGVGCILLKGEGSVYDFTVSGYEGYKYKTAQ